MGKKLAIILLCVSLPIITIPANSDIPTGKNGGGTSETGILYVVTEPSKADIYMDKHRIGITPGYYPVAVGSQKITIQKRFYQSAERDVNIRKDEITRLSLTLREGKGKITVLSTPLEAEIYIDGELQNSVTPATLPKIPAGKHTLRVVKDTGEHTASPLLWESDIELETDGTELVNAMLKPHPTEEDLAFVKGEKGFVYVVTEPPGADIYVDDEKQVDDAKQPILSPAVIKVTVGTHEIRVDKKFYQISTERVKVVTKQISHLKFALEKGVGHITIISTPELGAKIYFDKKLQNYETPITLMNIPAGKHELRVVKDKIYWRGEVDVDTDEITVQIAELQQDKKPPTRSIITTSQAIVINGGSKTAVSPKVTLTFNVEDETDVASVMVSNDDKFSNAQWIPYTPDIEWVFDSTKPGTKRVYVKFKDNAGIESDTTYSAEVELRVPMGMVYIDVEQDTKLKMRIATEDGKEKSETVFVKPYFIDKYEVTNAQYKEFVDATGYNIPDDWDAVKHTYPPGKGEYPIVNVSAEYAREYAKWAGKRLPTEAEWVIAAIGTDELKWPWGNRWDGKRANIVNLDGTNVEEVDNYPGGVSFCGVYNMAGNVWEWVEQYHDTSTKKLPFKFSDESEKLPPHFLRGGLLIINDTVSDTSLRLDRDYKRGCLYAGFRCAMSLSDWKER